VIVLFRVPGSLDCVKMSSLLGAADLGWEMKCRQEDLSQRKLENERRAIDDARRAVDEKAKQLHTMANQSALIAGFSMIVLVESQVSNKNVHQMLLVSFGYTTALVVSLMLLSMLNTTYMLVAILKYDTIRREIPFEDFWLKRCSSDWKFALRSFEMGLALFMILLGQIGWVVFSPDKTNNEETLQIKYYIAASFGVTIIACITIFIYFSQIYRKWTGWLLTNVVTLKNPDA